MVLEKKEIPKLLFWIFLTGVSFVIAATITKKVSEKVSEILK